jgi:16S rRNA (guanine966-N2)-methyltransferase
MRVIAGLAGGVRLSVPKTGVRPTMDRVKAAIFSSLGDTIIGARVLDLFAGSGALGIEALSRGASFALFVENDRQSIAAIEQNLARTGLQGHLRKQDVFVFLRGMPSGQEFRIIFADPPYHRTGSEVCITKKLLTCTKLAEILEPRGLFVLEKHPGEKMPDTPFWKVRLAKVYGATEVLFLQARDVSC